MPMVMGATYVEPWKMDEDRTLEFAAMETGLDVTELSSWRTEELYIFCLSSLACVLAGRRS
jgi:hypothetical protein